MINCVSLFRSGKTNQYLLIKPPPTEQNVHENRTKHNTNKTNIYTLKHTARSSVRALAKHFARINFPYAYLCAGRVRQNRHRAHTADIASPRNAHARCQHSHNLFIAPIHSPDTLSGRDVRRRLNANACLRERMHARAQKRRAL